MNVSNGFIWLKRQIRDVTFGGSEVVLLLAVLVVVGGVWLFIELADEVLEGETQRIDDRIVRTLRNPSDPTDPIGPKWLEEMFRDLTALGGVAVLVLVTAAVAGYLLLQHRRGAFLLILTAALSGIVLSLVLKQSFARPRPEVVPHLSYVLTASFPSGHSMLSAVVYLTLGAISARFVSRLRDKLYFITVALVLTGLVGISRVYLGVHYPTDILAGWMAGLTWATLCWLAAYWLQRRGTIDEPRETQIGEER